MFQYSDRVLLNLQAGHGGSGQVSFFRTRTNSRGGPDGGDGGRGGHIVLRASTGIKNLEHFNGISKMLAPPGSPGAKQLQAGAKGKNLILELPVGTLVRNLQDEILLDLTESQEKIFLTGGKGGRGNAFFKTSVNQAPKKVQKGMEGELQKVILEFKPLNDVALLGEVNSGKSTFFNQITRAQSKVGSYPYTTLKPHLAQMTEGQTPCFLIDIPGLDSGAHKSESRGLSFLRSIQRANLLIHFVACDHHDPMASKNKIEAELEKFDKKYKDFIYSPLSQKKKIVVLSCSDRIDEQALETLKKSFKEEVLTLSCHQNKGVEELISFIEKEALVEKEASEKQNSKQATDEKQNTKENTKENKTN